MLRAIVALTTFRRAFQAHADTFAEASSTSCFKTSSSAVDVKTRTELEGGEPTKDTILLQEKVVRERNSDGPHSPEKAMSADSSVSMGAVQVGSVAVNTTDDSGKIDVGPGASRLWIDVGPNFSPLNPEGKDADQVMLVLIDPLEEVIRHLKHRFKNSPRTVVMQAAVANYNGVAQFHQYNVAGASSSLAKPAHNASWNRSFASGQSVVPVVTLKDVLNSLPIERLGGSVELLKTDMQGYDFAAIQSAGELLRKVRTVTAEVYQDGFTSYNKVKNERRADWIPYMKKMGFEETECKAADEGEMDCTFSNTAYKKR